MRAANCCSDRKRPATLVLMPHTYQVRDFVPKLATALQTTAISDVIGVRNEGGKLLFRSEASGNVGIDAAYVSSAGFCAEAGNGLANHGHQRRNRRPE